MIRSNYLPLTTAFLLVTLLLMTSLGVARGQGTEFMVTVSASTPTSPHGAEAYPEAYFIDGVEAPELVLMRGTTYSFTMSGVPSFHPFYISTSMVGGGSNSYDEGVTNQRATGSQTLTFSPSDDTPDTLYYQCGNHRRMGWRLVIVNPESSVETEVVGMTSLFANVTLSPNPANGNEITLSAEVSDPGAFSLTITDASGRVVQREEFLSESGSHRLVIQTGSLPSGVYYYQLRAPSGSNTGTFIVAH